MPVEERIARLEADVAHIKQGVSNIQTDIRALRGDMKAANDSIAMLRADMHGLETRIIKWITGTVIGMSALAFSIAKFVA